jgi:hypothetical protein
MSFGGLPHDPLPLLKADLNLKRWDLTRFGQAQLILPATRARRRRSAQRSRPALRVPDRGDLGLESLVIRLFFTPILLPLFWWAVTYVTAERRHTHLTDATAWQ